MEFECGQIRCPESRPLRGLAGPPLTGTGSFPSSSLVPRAMAPTVSGSVWRSVWLKPAKCLHSISLKGGTIPRCNSSEIF